ncbi:MAG: VacJ family lipoprotein [Alphaproteobacteria bacterium GM202ARS2]|nr:VacJ family lipoprotein [Alphaproteobacteria bacterium GM202ARS2]
MLRVFSIVCVISLVLGASGCASTSGGSQDAFDDVNDPFESVNRAIFDVNIFVDRWTLRPLAIGYRALFPRFVRERVHNVITLAQEPRNFANALLQADISSAATVLGRILINATFGLGGLFEVAEGWGLEHENNDFGLTLGTWGVPSGPYLMLPFLGPHNTRHGIGRIADSFADPLFYVYRDLDVDPEANYGQTFVTVLDQRTRFLDELDALERDSLDFYAAVRSLYQQSRQSRLGGAEMMSPALSQDDDSWDDFDSLGPGPGPSP